MDLKKMFDQAKAIILDDHFVYAKKEDGWYHGSAYVNKDAIYPFTRFVNPMCQELANYLYLWCQGDIEVVVGPTVGGVSLSQWIAHWLSPTEWRKEVLAVYADEIDVVEKFEIDLEKRSSSIPLTFLAQGEVELEFYPDAHKLKKIIYQAKVGTQRILKRGYDEIVKGKICLVVEDIINSGTTVKKTIQAIQEAGGKIVAVGALCNRSGGKVTAETLGVPILYSLLNIQMEMHKEDECLVCKEKGPESVRTDLGKGKEFLIRKGLMK